MKTRILMVLITLFGCSKPNKTDTVIIFDQTDKRTPLDKTAVFKLYKNIDHGKITFTEITDQSITSSKTIAKQKSTPYITRVESQEREKDKKYKADFLSAVDHYNDFSTELEHSYVFSILSDQLIRLSRSKASERSILVIGDMCENTPQMNMYGYRENPIRILEEYELIVEILEGHYPNLKDADLSGITLSVVYHPSKEDDQLLRYVREFWSRYLQSKQVQIEFVTSLENSSLNL